jgi:hypothetical protein
VTHVTGTLSPVAEGSATLIELTHAVQAAAALAAAASTGTLAILDDGPATADEVASACATSPRHTELLLVALQALGLVERSADGAFRLTGTPLDFLERTRLDWARAEHVVRTGRSLHEVDTTSGARRLYPSVVPGLSVLGTRAAAVAARALVPAGRVLDAGAGAAPWSIAIARADPRARVTALDLAPVLARDEGAGRRGRPGGPVRFPGRGPAQRRPGAGCARRRPGRERLPPLRRRDRRRPGRPAVARTGPRRPARRRGRPAGGGAGRVAA